jgi:hypothetical protein
LFLSFPLLEKAVKWVLRVIGHDLRADKGDVVRWTPLFGQSCGKLSYGAHGVGR